MLITFSGLPGTGKSTLAHRLSRELHATYLRIDTIEQALRDCGVFTGDVGPAGYVIAYALAETNLRLGRTVVADSVNPISLTREAWRQVAAKAGVALVEVETLCSDEAEHRRRIETRDVGVPGLVLPDWDAIQNSDYQAWDTAHVVIDTAGRSIDDAFADLRAQITARDRQAPR
jgi:predicted kinase